MRNRLLEQSAVNKKYATIQGEPDIDIPDSLRKKHISVNIEVRVTIYGDNHPPKVEILKGSGYQELDQAVMTALTNTAFSPAIRDGKPIDSVLPITIPFYQN